MRKRFIIIAILVSSTMAVVAIAKGNWSAARSKAEDFLKADKELRRLTPYETRRIVSAVCGAEEEEREDAGNEVAERAKDKVTKEYGKLGTLKDEAGALLADVLADTSLAAHHGEARAYQADLAKRWKRITGMTKGLRGTNHPLVKFMVDAGQAAHEAYQKDSSRCDVYEFSVPKGRVDCLQVEGSMCWVIELKPDNQTAIIRGKEQAYRYARELGKGNDAYKRLVAKDKKFGVCTSFKQRIDCYTLCPEVDDGGEYTAVSAQWRADCK